MLLLGVSYKPGVADIRDSPALRISDVLSANGASVAYTDPYVPALACGARVLTSVGSPPLGPGHRPHPAPRLGPVLDSGQYSRTRPHPQRAAAGTCPELNRRSCG
ncbi:UDP-glucose/GDP-mannose dehydrogenase family protein [Streptomyces sp. NPDC052299]|uniref:UDP-glucose/GDP-mannose dehydrogenase family protein n=1 Tax=Streptomyces sp. NPDC052299 TaxID=3155054 RepID=UPI00342BDBD7